MTNEQKSINEVANRVILNKYPLWLQLNLTRKGGTELETMSDFINDIIAKSNEVNITLDQFVTYCIEKGMGTV